MRRLLFISLLLILLSSCQQEPLHSGANPGGQELELQQCKVELVFRLNAGTTKATVPVNSNQETKVTNLAVIACPVKSDGTINWKKSIVTVIDEPTINGDRFSGKVNAYVGNNVFYVLVNFTDEMLQSIRTNAIHDGYGFRERRESAFSPYLPSGSTFGEKQQTVLSQFMDPERGYTMMAKCTNDRGESQLQIRPDDTELELVGDLHRMLAKVHMEFEVYDPSADDKQVKVKGYLDDHVSEIPVGIRVDVPDGTGSQAGWVPLNSIRYCLNAVNTKVYLEPSDDCHSSLVFPEDPNYLLDNTLIADGADWRYAPGYENDFIFHDPNDVASLFNTSGTSSWMVTPPNSIYCLENMVNAGAFLAGFGTNTSYRKIAPRRATTHLLIEVQFTPRYIIVGRDHEGNRDLQYQGFADRNAAIVILKDDEHLEEPGDGTFWTPDLEHFYNWEGVLAEIAFSHDMHTADPAYRRLDLKDFVKYPKGKCYYTTFISGDTATDPEVGLTFSEKSSVRRDASYTLKATVLRVPSISTSMMEINTTSSLEWPDRNGYGSIEIKPQ